MFEEIKDSLPIALLLLGIIISLLWFTYEVIRKIEEREAQHKLEKALKQTDELPDTYFGDVHGEKRE